MTENSTDSAVRGETAIIAAGGAQPAAATTRRPRRMARNRGIGGEPAGSTTVASKPAKQDKPAKPKAESKIARVISLLGRQQGATLADLVEATGWLPHTTRAALTGLRKKGHSIEKAKRDDMTCYKLGQGA